MNILGCTLIQTSIAFPEQYDVFLDGNKIGYLRLRNGVFTAEYPDCGGKLVYKEYPKGGGLFEQQERRMYLWEAINYLKMERNLHVSSRC